MAQQRNLRKPIAALCVSAACLFGVMTREGFDGTATQPVPGDRWTYGYGSTEKEDGSRVVPGDKITKDDGRRLLELKINDEYGAALKRCAGDVELLQREYDYLLDLAYNIGWPKVCSSTSVKEFRAGNYEAGCKAVFKFDMLQGRHCSLPENRNRKDGCRGIMNRRQAQYDLCIGK